MERHLQSVGAHARSAVIFDSQPLWLEAVECVLGRAGIEVKGKTTSADEALSLLAESQADILILDISLADDELDGLQFLRLAQESAPEVQCIVLSAASDPKTIRTALEAGAVAYVFKSAYPDDLTSTVRQAFDHSVYLAQSPVSSSARRVDTMTDALEVDELTNREREILRLVSEGHSNAQLASMLWITEQTVKFHLSNVYRKLDVANRTEAARWAQLRGLLPSASEAV